MIKKVFLLASFCAFVPLLVAQHTNVLISADNSPNEPSICINPKNTNELVAGANLNNVYYSHDAGASWTQASVSCPWGIWGDPVIGVDTTGAFYFLHLSNPPNGSWIDRIVIQKSNNAGVTWSDGAYTGLNGTKAQDKHWIAVDPATNALYVTWTQFDQYGTSNPADSSVILFSKSTDGGLSWTPSKRINKLAGDCVDSDNTSEGAVPCVGPNGEVYVVWSNRNKLWFDRSTDGGQTWLDEDILVGDQPTGWDYLVPGISRSNGLPVSVCDLSGGQHHGTIYVNWSDQRNGAHDTEVWFSKSTDGGQNWSTATRVNDDNTERHQFFTWMTIDQVTGYLWFVFYDRRNYNDSQTDVYMAVSKDGGETFKNFKVSESPFIPNENVFFGDYNNVTAYNNVVRPIWTRLVGNDLSLWTAMLSPDVLVGNSEITENPMFAMDAAYPNPFSEQAALSFKLHELALVSLRIYDLRGQTVATLLDNQWLDYGKHIEIIDAARLALSPGTYIAVLTVDGKLLKQKMLKF
ncbi:MAG: T9SS type A sorting domain-containing protein [Saprospiraceae bacterium]|nr:T9SS type A sorting domain-containing protein [Saprospiraceae bacterium]